ncbi:MULTISPECIES: MarR family winged helix-turn-helix transcriptional regulator [unclassified Helicobacter]|uniref:MarR family winged helix-turn-helix transcriptional regulator n=1 Tax=unclassified Helicobacter TaxID=2593540 RepID=UPI000CF147D0|nr:MULTISPECIES: MarR family transcriptional regulator [unclassified Helicobacter]
MSKHEEGDLIKELFFTTKQLRAFIAKDLRKLDIGFEQAGILFLLGSRGALSISEIAQFFEKDKATISRTIKALEHKMFVKKQQVPEDKRSNHIKLTQLGLAKIGQLEGQKEFLLKKIKSAITAQEKQIFVSTLRKILEVIK